MKLELGAGHRPTRGYIHNDLHPFPHIEHVEVPWLLDLPDDSVDEVLALAFIEHLTYYEALDTFRNVARMLKPGGLFLFDVPDYPVWATYYVEGVNGVDVPFDMDAVRATLFGWGRWDGDEHKFGWDHSHLWNALWTCGFQPRIGSGNVDEFRQRAHRDRFGQPNNAHLYVVATAP